MRKAAGVFLVAILLLSLPVSLSAQTASTAAISGTVSDPTGAVVPGATVELTDLATNLSRSQQTNAAGQYMFANVNPGTYKLTVTMQGFRQASVASLKVEVATGYTLNFPLEVGAMAEVVEVTAGAMVELQTADATIGGVFRGEHMLRLPNITRQANLLVFSQPGVSAAGYGFNASGAVAGARGDQSTWSVDGVDVTQNKFPEQGGGLAPAMPVPAESIEELRTGISNPNATFGRSAGGQFAAVRKRGGNAFHGSAYWYHQNDNSNATVWQNNRTIGLTVADPKLRKKLQKPEYKDNRFGFTVGGPVRKDKTFFFYHFEGRRLPQTNEVARLVPSAALRSGLLQFVDASGVTRSYNLATSTACGSGGTSACDPRGLGLSPAVSSFFAFYPPGNDPGSGDSLNTVGFRSTADASQKFDYHLARLDHNFSQNWRFESSYMWSRTLANSTTQVDIGGILPGNTLAVASPGGNTPQYPRQLVAALTGQITPRLTNELRFGWIRWYSWRGFHPPRPQMSSVTSAIDLNGGASPDLLDEPLDVTVQRSRSQGDNQHRFQFIDNATWVKGRHTLQFGGFMSYVQHFHMREDKVVGGMTAMIMSLDAAGFVTIPSSQRPPTCTATRTTFCLQSVDVTRWNRLYAATLGIIDNVQGMGTRNAKLEPNPFGFPLHGDFRNRQWEFYFSDVWRVRPSLTLTYGLLYQWQEPLKERQDRLTLMVDGSTGQVLRGVDYIEAKRQAALEGKIFNPTIAYQPIRQLGRRTAYDTDWSGIGPRIAASWNPSYQNGLLGRLFGDRKTVFRGGYAIVYDRINYVAVVSIPMLGVGFGQITSIIRPNRTNCSVSGPTNTDANTGCRLGVDTSGPLPPFAAVTPPIIPSVTFGEFLSFQNDPNIKVGRNTSVDFTIQRELPGDMILEVGYVGRLGRRLYQNINFNSLPFFMKDAASGQTFAQAFDALAAQLRAGVTATAVATQPWFENQLPPIATLRPIAGCTSAAANATQCLAQRHTSDIVNGLLTNFWLLGIDQYRNRAGLQPINNLQIREMFMKVTNGRSNYHGVIVQLRKRMSHGFMFDFNYTLSRSLDQAGSVQNAVNYFSSSFFPDMDYGVSFFDHTHSANLTWYYELPFGRGRRWNTGNWADKLIGGWYTGGIWNAFSGAPLSVTQSGQALGAGFLFGSVGGALPTVKPNFGNSVNTGVAGSGGVGIASNPATRGSGLNLYADPEKVFNSFRHILLTQDGRIGRGVLRGLPHWGLDISLGKKTSVTESVGLVFSLDFFNVFNNPQFNDPGLSFLNRGAFGNITSQFNSPRQVQFGFRVEF